MTISSLSSGHWAMFLVFVILLLCGLGMPLPEEIPLLTAGYLVYLELVSLPTAIVVTFIGIMLGDGILFTIGNRMGLTVFEHRWFKRMINRKRLRLSRKYFAKHGDRIVFFARFVAGIRAPIFLSAAILRMPIGRFLLIDGLAALLSVPLSVYLAYYFGGEIEMIARKLRDGKLVVIVALVFLLCAFLAYRWWRRRNAKAESA